MPKIARPPPLPAGIASAHNDRMVDVPAAATLLEAARTAGVHLNASCNGKGSCGKCKLVVTGVKVDAPPTALLSVERSS